MLSYIVFVSCAGMVCFMLFRDGADYSALFTSALLLYYILVYIHMAKIDPLTSLLNRQSCYSDIKSKARAITGIVSVDMNDLKYFNDSFGHEAGDAALTVIAGILQAHCGRGGIVYRIGGDEFIIFYIGAEEAEIAAAIDAMRKALAQTPYACAFGYARKTPELSMHDALLAADREMYADKATLKKLSRS